MKNYWSCSKFAHWLRGTASPGAATMEEWALWKKLAFKNHPIRYWLAETALDNIQDFVSWPVTTFYNIKYYIKNRWVLHTHQLTASASHIKRGQWCDVGSRFLPCLFDSLVDFVEIEKAHMHCVWGNDTRKFTFKKGRCAEAGLARLNWESTLAYGESDGMEVSHPLYKKLTPQAKDAIEVLELYRWYTEIHCTRPDAHDVTGWSEYCQTHPSFSTAETPQEEKNVQAMLKKMRKLEEDYMKEDTQMMIRLIKIRECLWT